MDPTKIYILSQLFVLGNYVFLGLSYLTKTRHKIVIRQTIATGSNLIGYGLLGAQSGMAMCAIAVARNSYILWDEHHFGKSETTTRRDYILLGVVCLAIIVLAIFTYNGPLSLLVVLAFSLQTLAIWQKKPIVYKFIGIPMALLYLAYNAYVASLFGVVLEIVVLLFAVAGFILELRNSSKTSNN